MMNDECLIRLPEVLARTGLSRSAVYAKIAAGELPRPVALGPRARAWVASEITAWVQARIDHSRKAVA